MQKDWPKRSLFLCWGVSKGRTNVFLLPTSQSLGLPPFHALGIMVPPWVSVDFEVRLGFAFCLSHYPLHYLEAVIKIL